MQNFLEMIVDFSCRQTVEVDGLLSRSDELQEDFIASIILESVEVLVDLPECESEVNGTLTANDSILEVARASAIVPLQIAVLVLVDGADNANRTSKGGDLRSVSVHKSIIKQSFERVKYEVEKVLKIYF